MSGADLQKYLSQFKVFFHKMYGNMCRYALPKTASLVAKCREYKETIIKTLVPLGFIFLGVYTCTSSHNIVFKNISDIFEISDEIRNNYAGKPDYWGLSTQSAIQAGYIPQKFLQDKKIVIRGGNELFIGDGIEADMVMPGATFFDLILPRLNKAQCIAHTEAMISPENQVKLFRIQVINASGSYLFEWGDKKYSLPVGKYASKDVCADSDNTVIWSIR